MEIVVIGLGSMGKRRIRLIREMYPGYVIYGVDGRTDRQDECREQYGIDCYGSIEQIDKNVECAFVCTSPLSHRTIIQQCLEKHWHVFTEINLVMDGYKENMMLAEKVGKKLFLSSTFLYREETKYIREKVKKGREYNYLYHIGQYLPDWHPWENYKDFFLGDKRTNGCREILAIELPWIVEAFGNVTDIKSISDKMTELSIDYNDNYMIQLEHENGSKGVLVVEVVSPVAVRKMEIYCENEYISWDGTPESLKEYRADEGTLVQVELNEKTEHREGYRAFVVENAYRNEINEFFDVVLNKKEQIYDFKRDMEILQLIDRIGA